jgi:hypothetical protein
MFTITEKCSSVWIEPYVLHTASNIEKALSVYDFPTHKYTQFLYEFEPYENSISTGVLKIPRGIGMDFIKECFDNSNLRNYKVVDNKNCYPEPRPVEIKLRKEYSIPRDEYQINAIKFQNVETDPQKIVTLDTGFGKTYCAIYHIVHSKVPALLISKNLSEQWLGFVTQYTESNNDREVIMLYGSKVLEDIVKTKGFKKKHRAAFYITTIDTLHSFAIRYGTASLQALADELGIGIKIFDEAHSNFCLENLIDMNMQVKETIYLSATFSRSNSNEDRIFKKAFSHVPIHGTYTHFIKQYYFINCINYNSTPSDKVIGRCCTSRGFNSKFYSEYMFSNNINKAFVYGIIRKTLLSAFKADRSCKALVLLDWLKDIQFVHDALENDKEFKEMNISVGKYCSLVTNRDDREKEKECDVVIGTLGSVSAGKDIPGLRVIIPFTFYSSEVITRQLLGRLRYIEGKAVYQFDFCDEGFQPMLDQRRRRMAIYKPRAKDIKNVYYTFDEVISTLHVKNEIE